MGEAGLDGVLDARGGGSIHRAGIEAGGMQALAELFHGERVIPNP
jgi:hypothetical protein